MGGQVSQETHAPITAEEEAQWPVWYNPDPKDLTFLNNQWYITYGDLTIPVADDIKQQALRMSVGKFAGSVAAGAGAGTAFGAIGGPAGAAAGAVGGAIAGAIQGLTSGGIQGVDMTTKAEKATQDKAATEKAAKDEAAAEQNLAANIAQNLVNIAQKGQ